MSSLVKGKQILANFNSLTANTIGFTGNCVSDLYVTNIHSCSPLFINPLDEGNVHFGSTSGITMDLSSTRLGLGTNNPSATLDLVGTFQYVDGNEGSGKVLTSDASGNAVWSASTGGGGVSKYALTTGFTAGVAKSIPHNLSTADIQVQIWDSSNCVVDGDICLNGADGLNVVDVTMSVSGNYKVVVIG